MLKFLMRYAYRDKIHMDEFELFYKIYKWEYGVYVLIGLRRLIITILCCIIGTILMIFKSRTYGMILFSVGVLINILEIRELKRETNLEGLGMKTPAQIRTDKIKEAIRRYISINGKALGKKEWAEIKKHNAELYNELLSDECQNYCYYYSVEIAKIIKDSVLIWGAVKDPFDERKFYAHAVILRNGYIYDSNMRQSEKYEDFLNFYKFKTYKQWEYDDYKKEDFRLNERDKFRDWCKQNKVLYYEKF